MLEEIQAKCGKGNAQKTVSMTDGSVLNDGPDTIRNENTQTSFNSKQTSFKAIFLTRK